MPLLLYKIDILGGDLLDKARTELGLAEHGTGGEIHDSDVIDTDEAVETSESANIWSTNSTIRYSEVVPVILVGRLRDPLLQNCNHLSILGHRDHLSILGHRDHLNIWATRTIFSFGPQGPSFHLGHKDHLSILGHKDHLNILGHKDHLNIWATRTIFSFRPQGPS